MARNWVIRPSGNDANGGFWESTVGVSTYANQDAAVQIYTDLVIDSVTNTKCSSVARPFVAADVGLGLNVTSGTGWTVQRVYVVSVASGVATCSAALGTTSSTGGHARLGGALATVSDANWELCAAGETVWVLGGNTYTVDAAISMSTAGTAAAGAMTFRGFASAPAASDICDGTSRPTLSFGSNKCTLNNYQVLENMILTGAADSTYLLDLGANCRCRNCSITNTHAAGSGAVRINSGTDTHLLNCLFQSTAGVGVNVGGSRNTVRACTTLSTPKGFLITGSGSSMSESSAHTCPVGVQVGSGAANTLGVTLQHNTFYHTSGTTGISDGTTGSNYVSNLVMLSNQIDGFATGISLASPSALAPNLEDYNNISNCATPRANIAVGPHSTAASPGWVSAASLDMRPTAQGGVDDGGPTTRPGLAATCLNFRWQGSVQPPAVSIGGG